MTNEFKEGYCDGYSQAIENVRYNLLKMFEKKNEKLTINDIDDICNYCSKVDMNYLNQ